MNIDFPEDSDSSDADYIPEGPKELPSEVESDGDPEDPLTDSDGEQKGKKRKKKTTKRKKKAKVEVEEEPKEPEEKPQLNVEEKKKRDDDLWASFKKDTGFKTKKDDSTNGEKKDSSSSSEIKRVVENKPNRPVVEKVKVTQIFEFAGEEVKVEKEVPADSLEARLFREKPSSSDNSKPLPSKPVRGGLRDIGSVLSQLGKKAKVTTLEKSKLDWEKFKKEEKIEDELKAYTKSKDGYLDRQDFLQRADLRRFEIEKEVRTIERNKRMNNV